MEVRLGEHLADSDTGQLLAEEVVVARPVWNSGNPLQ